MTEVANSLVFWKSCNQAVTGRKAFFSEFSFNAGKLRVLLPERVISPIFAAASNGEIKRPVIENNENVQIRIAC